MRILSAVCLGISALALAPLTRPALAADQTGSLPIQSVMDTVIDPNADALWDVAGTVVTAKGSKAHQPRTPKQWAKARRLADEVVSGARLLQSPRPVGENGHWKLADASTPGIRSAVQIQADIARDPKRFYAAAARLQKTAQDAGDAIDRRDIPALLDAGARIDAACEACHSAYWYPRDPPRAFPAPDAFGKAAIRP